MNDILNKHFEGIETHRRLVWKIGNLLHLSEQQLTQHDLSKYGDEEFSTYAEWFYGDRNKEYAYQDFQRAWQHHIRYNPHHWQHWVLDGVGPVLIKDDIGPNKAIIMPHKYVVEMVVDWQAREIQSWGRQDMSDWLNKKFDEMTLHKVTRINIIEVLEGIGYRLNLHKAKNEFRLDDTTAMSIKIEEIVTRHKKS